MRAFKYKRCSRHGKQNVTGTAAQPYPAHGEEDHQVGDEVRADIDIDIKASLSLDQLKALAPILTNS
ncbi:hypothetical protein DESC_600048 [Desulfosarcina cetonica]|nr:hypothetical protein DESC_600048 [Desulfosarcina cetonica]